MLPKKKKEKTADRGEKAEKKGLKGVEDSVTEMVSSLDCMCLDEGTFAQMNLCGWLYIL